MTNLNRCISMLALGVAVATAGCGNESKLAVNRPVTGGLWGMMLTSPAFKNNEEIPQKYTADGENVSPPLTWSRGPDGTKQFVLIVQDPDAPGDEPALHWFVYQIPATTTSLPENASKTMNLVQGTNYLGKTGYTGADPPQGKKHRYFFQIFALDRETKLGPNATPQDVARALPGYVLSKGQLVGSYQRGSGG